jgi:hypothetical protein
MENPLRLPPISRRVANEGNRANTAPHASTDSTLPASVVDPFATLGIAMPSLHEYPQYFQSEVQNHPTHDFMPSTSPPSETTISLPTSVRPVPRPPATVTLSLPAHIAASAPSRIPPLSLSHQRTLRANALGPVAVARFEGLCVDAADTRKPACTRTRTHRGARGAKRASRESSLTRSGSSRARIEPDLRPAVYADAAAGGAQVAEADREAEAEAAAEAAAEAETVTEAEAYLGLPLDDTNGPVSPQRDSLPHPAIDALPDPSRVDSLSRGLAASPSSEARFPVVPWGNVEELEAPTHGPTASSAPPRSPWSILMLSPSPAATFTGPPPAPAPITPALRRPAASQSSHSLLPGAPAAPLPAPLRHCTEAFLKHARGASSTPSLAIPSASHAITRAHVVYTALANKHAFTPALTSPAPTPALTSTSTPAPPSPPSSPPPSPSMPSRTVRLQLAGGVPCVGQKAVTVGARGRKYTQRLRVGPEAEPAAQPAAGDIPRTGSAPPPPIEVSVDGVDDCVSPSATRSPLSSEAPVAKTAAEAVSDPRGQEGSDPAGGDGGPTFLTAAQDAPEDVLERGTDSGDVSIEQPASAPASPVASYPQFIPKSQHTLPAAPASLCDRPAAPLTGILTSGDATTRPAPVRVTASASLAPAAVGRAAGAALPSAPASGQLTRQLSTVASLTSSTASLASSRRLTAASPAKASRSQALTATPHRPTAPARAGTGLSTLTTDAAPARIVDASVAECTAAVSTDTPEQDPDCLVSRDIAPLRIHGAPPPRAPTHRLGQSTAVAAVVAADVPAAPAYRHTEAFQRTASAAAVVVHDGSSASSRGGCLSSGSSATQEAGAQDSSEGSYIVHPSSLLHGSEYAISRAQAAVRATLLEIEEASAKYGRKS